jgi:hypothetical protein
MFMQNLSTATERQSRTKSSKQVDNERTACSYIVSKHGLM